MADVLVDICTYQQCNCNLFENPEKDKKKKKISKLSLKIFNSPRKPYYVTLGVTVIFTTPFCQTVEDEGVLENSASGLSKTDLDL